MKSFSSYNIGIKITIIFVIIILVPIAVLELIQHIFIINNTEKLLLENTRQLIYQAEKNIDFYIQDLEDLSYIISKDENVLTFIDMKSDISSHEKQTVNDKIIELQLTIHATRPEIAGIMVVNVDDEYVSERMYKTARDPFYSENWYKTALSEPDTYHLINSTMGRNISTSTNYAADEVITFVKAIKGEDSREYTGVIVIDMYLSALEEMINEIKPSGKGFIYISDEQGNIVYTPTNKVAYRISPKVFENPDESTVTTINDKNYQILYRKSQITDWYTVGVFESEVIFGMLRRLRIYTSIITTIIFGLAIVFVFGIERSFVNPLISLKDLMGKAEDGDMNVRYIGTREDEIGQLGISFNRMIAEIQKLLDMVEKEHEEQIEAEIRVLQAQIKPHFLYNTLDTIRWMALEHKADDIVDIIKSLTNLFRIGLSKGKEVISLSDEIEHVKSYLKIQKARYEDMLEYQFEIDKSIENYKVLKLILQPLVENAIYHGIKEAGIKGIISIRCEIEDGFIVLIVSDNGIGITKEKLERLNRELKEGYTDNRIGYGIFNINKRIKLYFGDRYGVQILSEENKGTTVFVTHPILFNESEIANENNDSR